MARYIDADKVHESIETLQIAFESSNDRIWEKNKPYYKGLAMARAVINETPTADVVPRAEVEGIIYKLECLLCHATGNKLSKHTYDLRTMETVVTDYINESYNEGYRDAESEVAREIFGEICEIMNSLYSRVQHDCVGRHGDDPHTIMLVGKLQGIEYLGDEIAELEKKYAEGGNER